MDKEDKVERGVDLVNQGEEGDGQGDGQGQEIEGQDEGDEDDAWEGNQGMDQEREDGEGQEAKEGNGEVVAEGKGQQGKAERPAALAVAAPYKMDKGGNHMVVGGTVIRYALNNKEKYDKRKAKVERLNTRAAVVLMLEGPAQGEKRKVDYNARGLALQLA